MQLQTLTHNELLRHAHVQFDPLTGTELEAELLRRFEVLVDEEVAAQPLLDLLREFDIDDPATLKKLLQRNAQLHDVLDSLAQPMADLQALAA